MNAEANVGSAPSVNGHMIVLGPKHSIAIYERNRECYVAEFRDGRGSLEYASSWFRFHAGMLRCYTGRGFLRSSMPLSPDVLEKIERLHDASDARQARMLAVPRSIAATVQRWISIMSRLRGASKISQTIG